jgi:ABC-type cobalamin transport system ATPase subunit
LTKFTRTATGTGTGSGSGTSTSTSRVERQEGQRQRRGTHAGRALTVSEAWQSPTALVPSALDHLHVCVHKHGLPIILVPHDLHPTRREAHTERRRVLLQIAELATVPPDPNNIRRPWTQRVLEAREFHRIDMVPHVIVDQHPA